VLCEFVGDCVEDVEAPLQRVEIFPQLERRKRFKVRLPLVRFNAEGRYPRLARNVSGMYRAWGAVYVARRRSGTTCPISAECTGAGGSGRVFAAPPSCSGM
jgi:hypothetical protein